MYSYLSKVHENVNVDVETGIHYGVIPVSEFDPEIFYEECVPVYRCEECEFNPANSDEYSSECDFCENYDNIVIADGMEMRLDEYNDVWILKSKVYTKCARCSPCAPNAGYVKNQEEYGVETYIPHPSWLLHPEKFKFINLDGEFINDMLTRGEKKC